MNSHQAIKQMITTGRFITDLYISDFKSEELIQRPAPESHHVAFQLGHLLLSEIHMMSAVIELKGISNLSMASVKLPGDFAAMHDKEAKSHDDSSKYPSLEQYRSLMNAVRAVTLATLEGVSEEDFDAPGPIEMAAYAPTIGSIFLTIAIHEVLHNGQIAVVRRRLKKPIVM